MVCNHAHIGKALEEEGNEHGVLAADVVGNPAP